MFRQHYPQRFRRMYSVVAKKVGRKAVYYSDPRDKQIGTIPAGTIPLFANRSLKRSEK